MKGPVTLAKLEAHAEALLQEQGSSFKFWGKPHRNRWSGEMEQGCFEAWSGTGLVFEASSCHVLCVPWLPGEHYTEVWGAFIAQVREGVKQCTEPDCEICHECSAPDCEICVEPAHYQPDPGEVNT